MARCLCRARLYQIVSKGSANQALKEQVPQDVMAKFGQRNIESRVLGIGSYIAKAVQGRRYRTRSLHAPWSCRQWTLHKTKEVVMLWPSSTHTQVIGSASLHSGHSSASLYTCPPPITKHLATSWRAETALKASLNCEENQGGKFKNAVSAFSQRRNTTFGMKTRSMFSVSYRRAAENILWKLKFRLVTGKDDIEPLWQRAVSRWNGLPRLSSHDDCIHLAVLVSCISLQAQTSRT
jgi:hypothetical protein